MVAATDVENAKIMQVERRALVLLLHLCRHEPLDLLLGGSKLGCKRVALALGRRTGAARLCKVSG
jgi:hypothetical protein